MELEKAGETRLGHSLLGIKLMHGDMHACLTSAYYFNLLFKKIFLLIAIRQKFDTAMTVILNQLMI